MNSSTLRTRHRSLYRPAFWALTFLTALLFPLAATAQSGYRVLYNFCSVSPNTCNDGLNPSGTLIRDAAGNLYGTTNAGGTPDGGTVFMVGSGGGETVLYSFCHSPYCPDGSMPDAGVVMDSSGNLYGTTEQGGKNSDINDVGTVFKLSGGGETVLYAFCPQPGCTDGYSPETPLVMDSAGNLYGAAFGGTNNDGVVFRVGSGGGETVLHSFTGSPDGASPISGLIRDSSGNLYGTTTSGGSNGNGAVFKLNSAGQETILYSFAGSPDGANPTASLILDSSGNLYGTTQGGGAHGAGTVFKLDSTDHETVLYSFSGSPDGAKPVASLILDSAGNLYGTTSAGGNSNTSICGSMGCGTVFELNTTGQETVLYRFCAAGGICTDGALPTGNLILDSAGNLYGTTQDGGANCCGDAGNISGSGTVFELSPGASARLLGPDGCGCIGGTGAVGVGEPIDTASGNMSYELSDYTTAGQNPLAYSRYYNSRASAGGITTFATTLGVNWRSTFDRYLQINSTSQVTAERASGRQYIFALVGSVWTPPSDVDITLTNSGSTWTLTDHDDTVETYTTTSAGNEALLDTIQSRNGYTQTLHYNGSSQLTGVTDSYNRSLTLIYNSNGTLDTLSTPDSTTLTYGYTAGGSGMNLTSITYPTSPSSVLTYKYGENGAPANALTGIIDENNNRYATWTYDSFARGTSSEIGSGSNAQVTSVAYNPNGTTTATNAFGVQDTYSYSTLQNIPKASQISRAATGTTAAAMRTFTYDTNGYLKTATDWNGNQTTYTNDTHGDPTKIVEPTRTTTISYDPTFVHLAHQIVTTGLTSTFAYDTSGNLHTRTDADTTSQTVPYSTNGQTRIWTYTYNNFLLASVQNPRTDVTAITNYGYGSDGALTSITDALTHATNITSHTGGGRPLTVVDPNSVTTTLTYDARQRLTTSAVTTSAGVLTTTYTIDPASELTKVTLPDSSFLAYGYDSAHRVTQATDTQGNYVQYTPDSLGDITAINAYNNTSGLRYQHSATFDALGRILTDVGGASQTTTYSNYDNNGNVQTITDPLLNPATQIFDALNRLTQITDANTGITKFAYDTHDRTTKVTDADSHATSYVFDGFGDAIQRTSPDSGVTVYYYNGDADLTQKVDALSVITNYAYDQLDRIASRIYPADGTQNAYYTYDKTGFYFGFGVGRLSTLTDTAGFVNLKYDERGNVLSTRRYNSGGTNLSNVYYSYDQASRVTSVTYPSGMTVSFYRDSIGNIWKVTALPSGSSTQQTVAFAAYEPFGPLYSLTYGDNETSSRQFDLDYRMSEVTDANSGATNLMDLKFGLDAANNLKTVTDTVNSGNNQSLGYDVLNRLHTASGNYGSFTWNYDNVGNPKTVIIGSTTTTYTYTSGSNKIKSIKVGSSAAVTVVTNADGNITSIPPANSTTAATFAYNVANRLSSVSGTPLLAATFAYDGFGQRYSKTNPGSNPITYAYDLASHLLEENNNGSVTDYIYLNGMPLGIFVPGGTNGTLYYVHTDRLATPQLVTNSAQAAVWNTTYQPYGTTPSIVSSIVQNLRFPGQNYDLETGFSYNLNRDYMPNIGRYLEADPIGINGGLNPYRYANANPGTFTDRQGLDFLGEQFAEAGLTQLLNQGGLPKRQSEQVAAMCVAGALYAASATPPTWPGLAGAMLLGLAGEEVQDSIVTDPSLQAAAASAANSVVTGAQSVGQSINQWITSPLQELLDGLVGQHQ